MRATEMYDLLCDTLQAVEKHPYYHVGEGAFKTIWYCDFCGAARTVSHLPSCILARLEKAVHDNKI